MTRTDFGKNAAVFAVLVVTAFVGSLVAGPGIAHADDAEDAARQLVAFVPKVERYHCSIGSVSDLSNVLPAIRAEAASVSVRLRCGPDGVAETVDYFQFTNADAMNRAYTSISSGTVGKPYRSTEGKCPGEQTWGFHQGNDGRVACDYSTTSISNQPISETVYRVWTDTRHNILAFASPRIGRTDAVALRDWWNKSAGPLETADSVQGLATATSIQLNPTAERTLLSHTPRSVRPCTVLSRNDPAGGSIGKQVRAQIPLVFTDRLWINAAVECTPTQPGATTVTYLAIAPVAIDGYFEVYKPFDDTLNGKCPAIGTWSAGKGAKKHRVGEYACYFTKSASGSQIADYAWTDRALGIVGLATNNTGDAAALDHWWNGNESGPH